MKRNCLNIALKYLIGASLALIAVSNYFNALSNSSLFVASPSSDVSRSEAAKPRPENLSSSPSVSDKLNSGSSLFANTLLNPASADAKSPFAGLRPAASASPFAASLTATKTDNISTPVNPGDTIMYTVVITNTGTVPLTNVNFTDTIDANTTLVGGSVNTSPIAVNDNYTASGNIPIAPAASVLANDIDPDTGNNTGLTVTQVQGAGANVGVATNTTATGIGGIHGSVTLQANGSFGYEPPPGFAGDDTFTYQISDAGGKTDTGTVTITISQMVWFIDNSSVAPNSRGTFSQPFKTIAEFNTVNTGAAPNPQPGQFIALRRGTGTYNETDGINLRDNQKLIGEAVAFNTVFTADANSTSAYTTFAGGTMAAPSIVTTAGNGVDLASGNTARGFNVGNTPGFFGFNGGAVGSPTINTVAKTGTGGAISVSTSGAFGANVTFDTLESTSSAGANLNLVGITGTLGVTSPGTGFAGSAAASAAINISGGSVSLTYAGNVTKANTGALLSVSGGHTGTLTFNTGTLSATNGTGLQFDNADGTYSFNGTNTLNGGDAGVDILNGSGGTFSFSSATTITSPTGTAFNVNGSSPVVTYSGSITQNTSGSRVVNIDTTTSNTITFQTGTITGGSSSTGVNINAANGNVTFSNGMTMGTSGSRMTNQAVTIAGGTGTYDLGVVSIFTNNASGIVATNADGTLNCSANSVVDSSGATAINIDGPAGLTSLGMTLTSVTSAGGTADGISIQDTNGSFTINGDGANTSVGGNSTGGTISNKSGADGSTSSGIGVFLNNATNITLRRMTINGTNQNFAIRASSVTGFTLDYSTVSGTNGTNDSLNEGSLSFSELTGSASFTNDNISGGWEDNLVLDNTTGTLDRLTMTNSTMGPNSASFGNAALNLKVSGTGVMKATVTGCTFTGSRSHFVQYLLNGNSTPTGDFVFTNNTITQSMVAISGAGGVFVSSGGLGNPTFTFKVQSNTIHSGSQPIVGGDINVSKGAGTGNFNGIIDNNIIGTAGVVGSGSTQASGIAVIHIGGGTYTVNVTNNQVRRYNDRGIFVQVGDNTSGGQGTVNANITGNTVAEPDSFALHGLHLNIGTTAGDTMIVCATVGGAGALKNTLTGSGVAANGGFDIRSQQRNLSTIRLPGYGGANNDNNAVATFFAGQNTTGGTGAMSISNNVAGGGGGYVGGASCPTSSVMSIGGPIEAQSLQTNPTTDSPGSSASTVEGVLRAARGEGPYDDNLQKLKQEELNWMVQAAITRWIETGISAEDLARMQSVTFDIVDLPNGEIASADSTHIKIDETGASYGWFFDQSPSEDGEFQVPVPDKELHTNQISPARGKMDLLTVVMRELGQIYLQGKDRLPKKVRRNLKPMMEPTLSPGVRRLPLNQWRVTPPSTVGFAKPTADDSVKSAAQSVATESNGHPIVAQAEKNTTNVVANPTDVPTRSVKIPGEARHAVFNPETDQLTPTTAVMRVRGAKDARNYEANRGARAASYSPAGGMVNVGPFTLPVGKSVTIMFNVTVNNPVTAGTTQVCNQGSVTSTEVPGPTLTNDPDTVAANDPTCTQLNVADLAVTKTDSPDPVTAGNNITYTVTVTNNGPVTANSVTLNDAIPANTTFVSTTTPAGWTRNDSTPVGGTGTLMFSKPTMANAEAATFTIVVKVNASTASGTTITNTATAATTSPDPTANDSATATTTVNTSADLAVTKTDSPDPVNAGANITYTINFTNNGPSDAQTVTVTDAVPANTTFVSAVVTTGSGWSTSAPAVGGTGNVVFSKATVAVGETAVFTVVVNVNASTPNATVITNNAVAASTTTDPTPANNTGTATTTVIALADLAVTKSDSPDPVFAGNNITYTINFVNNGPATAGNVTVTDAVPANATFVSAVVTTGSGWSISAPAVGGTGNVVFSKAAVPNAETAVFTIVVKVNSNTASATIITNSATAATTSSDPDGSNNTATATTTVNTQADLAVTKSDSPDPVSAGANLTYTINFANNGPSDAQTVTVTDAVPANTTFASAVVTTGSGWSTSAPAVGGTGNVVFSKATVTAGETAVFTIVVNVGASTASGTTITNSAVAATVTTDPTPANDTGTATTTVQTRADLAVTKSDSPDPVTAGNNLTYTINFSSAGPSDAQTVTVTDAVPANTTFMSAMVTSGSGWSISAPAVGGTGNVVFSKATVVSGETATFSMVVNVSSGTLDGTIITNSATAASATTDPTPGNNTGTATTTVSAMADLAVTKSDSPDPVFAGNNITYTINFANNGPSSAQSVTVTDATPANTTFVSAVVTTGSGWSISAPAVGGTGNVVFSKASVAAGETAVFTMVVNVNSNAGSGTITNNAVAASTTTDPTPGNNTGTATTTVQAQADLAVTKSDSPDPVTAGSNLTYTINFVNNGPSDAATVTVTDAVPANTTFVSAVVTTGSGWSISAPAVGGTGNVVFSKAMVMAGETAVFTIVVNVNANTANGATITNSATAASATSDPSAGNSTGTATTTVQTQADLAVTKSDSPDPVTAGNNLTYTINFTNNGPSDAQTVTVTDAVPANATFVSAVVTTGTGWSTSAPAVGGTGNVVFSKATVATGETAVFTIVVNINSNTANGATITNSATAASSTTDPTPGNDTGTATTTVQTSADIAVTKSDSPDPVIAGSNLTYTINFVNNGPSDAQTVTVTDAVPANTTFVSAVVTTGSGWSISAPAVGGTGNVVFSKASVAAGETAVFTMVVKVNSNTASGATITNSAVGASATTDPTPGNNTGTATTTVQVNADLAVTKSDSPDPVVASQNLTYTINFSNNGPSDAQSVTVTDAVPANTTFVSAVVTTGSGWSISAPAVGGTGNVVFSKAAVVAGETAVFTIVVNVNAGTPNATIITNSATAASATADSTPANNTGTATTTVIAQADLAVTKSDSPDPACSGQNLTYTIGYSNNGPGPGLNVTVTDAVPANTTFVSAAVTTGSGWSISAPAVGGTGNVVFSKASSSNGDTAVFTIVVKVNLGTPGGTTITNSVTVASTITDPTPGNNTAMATTTVDPTPPTITCPANVVATATSPGSTTVIVNYPPPTVMDNCPGATAACVPPSGSSFPLGSTTVTCTATDTSGNTAMCSFTVTTFDVCIQDDSNPATVLLWNSTTGDYVFCCGGVVYTGKGTILNMGNVYTLTDNTGTKRVKGTADKGTNRGTGYIQSPPGVQKCSITDRDIRNNTCACSAP